MTATVVLRLVEANQLVLQEDLRVSLLPELADINILSGFGEGGRPIFVKNTEPITLW